MSKATVCEHLSLSNPAHEAATDFFSLANSSLRVFYLRLISGTALIEVRLAEVGARAAGRAAFLISPERLPLGETSPGHVMDASFARHRWHEAHWLTRPLNPLRILGKIDLELPHTG